VAFFFTCVHQKTKKNIAMNVSVSEATMRALRKENTAARFFAARECSKLLDQIVWYLDKEYKA